MIKEFACDLPIHDEYSKLISNNCNTNLINNNINVTNNKNSNQKIDVQKRKENSITRYV